MPTRRVVWSRRGARETLRQWKSSRLWRQVRREDLSGYGYALLGVAAASLAIALVGRVAHITNISLLYLPVVLFLAAWVGRGPAILASVLSFLAYDFFFIPPLYHFTVDNPTEWLSLLALLVISLVTGQLASAVRDRAREAQQSQQRTATLYGLAQVIASATDQASLFNDLAQRLLKVFAPSGVTGVAILLPSDEIYPSVRAFATGAGGEAEQRALRIEPQIYAAEAAGCWNTAQPLAIPLQAHNSAAWRDRLGHRMARGTHLLYPAQERSAHRRYPGHDWNARHSYARGAHSRVDGDPNGE